jgi:hypothetical protein
LRSLPDAKFFVYSSGLFKCVIGDKLVKGSSTIVLKIFKACRLNPTFVEIVIISLPHLMLQITAKKIEGNALETSAKEK